MQSRRRCRTGSINPKVCPKCGSWMRGKICDKCRQHALVERHHKREDRRVELYAQDLKDTERYRRKHERIMEKSVAASTRQAVALEAIAKALKKKA